MPDPTERPRAGLLRGNVLWLSIVSLLNDAASEMIYPLLPLFVTGALGMGPAFLGLVEGVAESTASVLKLAGGRLSDRLGKRRALVGWGYGIAALGRPLIAAATMGWHVLVIRFADRVGKGIRTAPRDALLAESVPEERRGEAFGIHRAFDHAGAVVGPLLAAAVLLARPGELRLVFALALVPGLLTLALVLLKVRDPAPERGPAAPPPPLPRLSELGGTMSRYLAVVLLFTLGNATDAFLLLRAHDLGVSAAFIPLLWAALHVSKSLWSVAGGRMSDRRGPRRAIVLGWIAYASVYLGFATASETWHAWALFLAYGLFFGLTEAPEKALVASLAPAGGRGTAFGAYHMVVGLGALPASFLFGAVWEGFGAPRAFGMGAALAVAAALLLPLAIPRPPSPLRA